MGHIVVWVTTVLESAIWYSRSQEVDMGMDLIQPDFCCGNSRTHTTMSNAAHGLDQMKMLIVWIQVIVRRPAVRLESDRTLDIKLIIPSCITFGIDSLGTSHQGIEQLRTF